MEEAGADGGSAEVLSGQQRLDLRTLVEGFVDTAASTRDVQYRSVDVGLGGDQVGVNYRRGGLMLEYQTTTNAGGDVSDLTSNSGTLVDLEDHTPLRKASERYEAIETTVLETVAKTVVGVPEASVLDPVVVWPVTSEAGLYRVGFDRQQRHFLYAAAFKIPDSVLEDATDRH